MIDVSEIIGDPDFNTTIHVVRPAAGAFQDEGVWTPGGSATEYDQIVIVQPAKKDDLVKYVPEGERQNDAVQVWANPGLNMSDGNGLDSDTFIYNGGNYRVAFTKKWDDNGFRWSIGVGYVP